MQEPTHPLNPRNWVEHYSDELYAFALLKTGNGELAKDLVQETFLAGLKSMATYRGESSERTWLYAILKFKIAGHYRKASTRYEQSSAKAAIQIHSPADDYFKDDGTWKEDRAPADWGIDYSKAIENKELAAALDDCIERLPDTQKQIVVLKLLEEQDTDSICKELNISATNYWVIIHRAKMQLRACLEIKWFKA